MGTCKAWMPKMNGCLRASCLTSSVGWLWVHPVLLLEMQTFLLGLSEGYGRDGSCWPSPCRWNTGVISQRLSLRESFSAQKIRTCLRNCFGVLDTLCFSLLTVLQDRAVSFYTEMDQQSPVVWHVGALTLTQHTHW